MVSYSDSEVKIFHPLCEASLNWALKNLSLEKEYEVLHHQYTGTLEMDYVVRNIHTKKYLCVVEVKDAGRCTKHTLSNSGAVICADERTGK